ncbi:hypothetical protein L9F63_015192, partial [Diploptera punctata]
MVKMRMKRCVTSSAKINVRNDIYSAIKPLFYISKIIGLAPFSYNENHKFGFQISRIGTLYSLFLCVLLTFLFGKVLIWRIRTLFLNQKFIVGFVVICDSCLFAISIIVSYFLSATFNKNKLLKFLRLVSNVDLCINVSKISYKRILILVTSTIILVIVFYVMLFTVYYLYVKPYAPSFRGNIIYFLFSFLGEFMAIHFTYSVLLLKHRFDRVNNCLLAAFDVDERTLDELQSEIVATSCTCKSMPETISGNLKEHIGGTVVESRMNSDDTPKIITRNVSTKINDTCTNNEKYDLNFRIKTLRTMHSILCEAVQLTNSMYQIQNLINLMEIFLKVILFLFAGLSFLSRYITCGHNPWGWKILSWLALITCMKVFRLVTVIWVCQGVRNAAGRTGNLVHKLLVIKDLHKDNIKELFLFSKQVLDRPIQFSTCGFFLLDFAVVNSMAGAVTTYLIILLQHGTQSIDEFVEICNSA